MELPRNQRAIDATQPGTRRLRYRIKDVPGLHLEIHPTGRRVFLVRYQIGRGRTRRVQRWVTIGLAADVPLARAITKAQEIRANAVLDGRDEVAERRAAENPQTLNWLFEEWSDRHGKKTLGWGEIERHWNSDISSRLGGVIAKHVTRQDIAKLRDDIGRRSPAMGDRAAGLVGRVFNWAVDAGFVDANPAMRLHKIAPPKPEGRVLSTGDLRIFLTRLPASALKPHTKAILLLLTLLGQRRTEVAHMAAAELEGDLWTIPGTRTKNRRAHVIPLPPWAAGTVLAANDTAMGGRDRGVGFLRAAVERSQCPQEFGFLIADTVGVERDGRLHRHERQHLEHVVLEDVAEGSGLVVVVRPVLDAQCLGNGDLDIVDVVAVPDRLEDGVRKAKDHDILDRLFA